MSRRLAMRGWSEHDRERQRKRFRGLRLQTADEMARRAVAVIRERRAALPEGTRLDAPGVNALSRVLGLFESGYLLKRDSMTELELSTGDIARLVGLSRATVCLVLRWLYGRAIRVAGDVVAHGLGWIEGQRRAGRGRLMDERHVRPLRRTSILSLSMFALVALKAQREAWRARKADNRAHRESEVTTVTPIRLELPPAPERTEEDHAYGLAAVRSISAQLALA